MAMTAAWTGRTACALQDAMRLSNERFAACLGIGVRTVAAWHQKPTMRPKSELQQILDTALEQAPESVKERFARLVGGFTPAVADQGETADAERRLATDPNVSAALEWLDRCSAWAPGTARRHVASRLVQLDVRALHDRGAHRGRVDQRRIAQALGEYYGAPDEPYGRYGARCDDQKVNTSVLTCSDWLDLDAPLAGNRQRLALASATDPEVRLDDDTAGHAVQRLAETLALGIRLVDMPLYRLNAMSIGKGAVAGSVAVTRFVRYALTMDLLEGELIDALATDAATGRGSLAVRDRYLPDLTSVLDVAGRLCAGGTLALCAIARPATPYRGAADYVLLVQERSGHVVNAARRLAVIPKGFHQPLADYRADADIAATLLREMEEELFGRADIDNTIGHQRSADPMHPSRLSEPMRWLMDDPGRLRMECTGFGLNLVSGNYEFASIIVIEDDEFWSRYGGLIEANWEASRLRQYSSLDREQLAELISDTAWSNEGLFALLQGLRRLERIDRSRVDLPTIEWEIAR